MENKPGAAAQEGPGQRPAARARMSPQPRRGAARRWVVPVHEGGAGNDGAGLDQHDRVADLGDRIQRCYLAIDTGGECPGSTRPVIRRWSISVADRSSRVVVAQTGQPLNGLPCLMWGR